LVIETNLHYDARSEKHQITSILSIFLLVSVCMSAVSNTTLRLGKSNFSLLDYFWCIDI